MTLETRLGTSPRRPLRGPFGALPGQARPFAVDRTPRQDLLAPRAYPTVRRDGEPRVPRRYGPVKTRRAAPSRRDSPVLAHVWRGNSVDYTQLFPTLVNFACFFGNEDYRTYSDYINLGECGIMAIFTRTFAYLREHHNQRIIRKCRLLPPDCGLHRLS